MFLLMVFAGNPQQTGALRSAAAAADIGLLDL